MDLLIKKGKPHGHRYGKSQATKNIIWLTNWRRNAKRKSPCDSYEIMNSVFEHNRDEEVCRRWDFLADEDHTYHLSKKYFYYKNKWWLHLNKSGSNSLPLRKRSDFKKRCLPWNAYTKNLEKNHSCPLIPTSTNNDKIHNGFLKIPKVKEEASKSLGKERGDQLLTLLWRKPQKMTRKNSISSVSDRLFTADVGLMYRRDV